MTTLRDLPPGTKCLVDVAAMERDGHKAVTGVNRCGCPADAVEAAFRTFLRQMSEVTVVITGAAIPPIVELSCGGCHMMWHRLPRDDVDVGEGLLMRRKYLLPLPEHGGETDGR